MNDPHTWIIIPGYNEGSAIGETVRSLADWLPRVVVVDDGSADETAEIATAAGARAVRHPMNLGQGAALATGIRYAVDHGAEFIVTFDADGQHLAEDIHVLLQAASRTGADVVLGSRFLGSASNMPASRRLLLRLATTYLRRSTGLVLTDAHNGLRLLNRRAAQSLQIRQNRMAHASEILNQLSRSKLKVVEAPVRILYTEYSLAKGQTFFSAFNILWDLALNRLHR